MLQSYEAIYEHGHFKWIGEEPPVAQARVIVTVLPVGLPADVNQPRRQPSSRIAGKGKILGDIMSPAVPPEDWNSLK